jgi:hypothetical protein
MEKFFIKNKEYYEKKCAINRLNGAKWWRPKEENPEEPKETQENPKKPNGFKNNPKNPKANASVNVSSSVNSNSSFKKIIINNNNSNELLVLDKKEYWNKEINELQAIIKKEVTDLWFIYKPWTKERERIKNILTAKEYWNICENSNMTRIEFCIKIIQLSNKLEFWKWKINNAETFYNFYAKVYNEWKKKKEEIENKSRSYTSVF